MTSNPTNPVFVEADLDVTIEGKRCRVWTEAGGLVVNAPNLATAKELLAGVETLPIPQSRLADGLTGTGLTVEVRVRHAPVARLGDGVESSWLASVAGYDADFSPRGVLVAGWRRLG